MSRRGKCQSNRKPSRYTYFREMDSVFFTEYRMNVKFSDFIKERILPVIPLTGYKLKQKHKIAIQCILNLSISFEREKTVADSRDTSKNGLRIGVWDSLVEAGLCRVCIGVEGIPNELKGYVSRYYLTGKLLKLLQEFEHHWLDYNLCRNSQRKYPTAHSLVLLHSGVKDLTTGQKLPPPERRKPIPFTGLPRAMLRRFKKIENRFEIINRNNLSHSWQAFCGDNSFIPNPCHKQTHAMIPYNYMRIVQWSDISIQSLSKKVRKTVLIDGEPTVELDYSGFDLRRCYHYKDIDPDRDEDIYRPNIILPNLYASGKFNNRKKEIVRDFIKTATNICFNVPTQQQAVRAIRYQLRTHKEKRLLYGILHKVERIPYPAAGTIIKRIIRAHPDIRTDFFRTVNKGGHTVCIGSRLMTKGAVIMQNIFWQFVKANKPAVSIHDAILCKRSDAKFARRIMTREYKKRCSGYKPVIKREF